MNKLLAVLAVGFAAAACSGSGDDDDAAPDKPTSCLQSGQTGTFLVHYDRQSGDCSVPPDHLVRVDDPTVLDDGCVLDAPDEWSENDCKLVQSYTCTDDSDGSATSLISVVRQADTTANLFVGTFTVTARDSSGALICSGTYGVRATRQ